MALRANADGLGSNVPIIYAGDYNIRSSSEEMYQTLLSPGPGQAFDPIDQPGTWHENTTLRLTHTQSPADNTTVDLTRGGVDDRFDFQLVTAALLDSTGLSYLPDSYHTFGNNASHPLNASINHPSNTAQPRFILNALARVSDHLPVVADYQIPSMMRVDFTPIPELVLQGAQLTLDVKVANVAPVISPFGADILSYDVEGVVALSGSFSGEIAALAGENVHSIAVDTSTIGPRIGQLEVNSNSEAEPLGRFREFVNYTVLAHARGSLSTAEELPIQEIDFGIVRFESGLKSIPLEIANIAPSGAASLDIDDVAMSEENSQLAVDLVPRQGLGAGESEPFAANLRTDELGPYNTSVFVAVSDEDLPGEQTDTLSLFLIGTVALPGDTDLDQDVDFTDFVTLTNHFNLAGQWQDGDFNSDRMVDFADFTDLSNWFGRNASVVVPEGTAQNLVWHFLVCVISVRFIRGTRRLK